MAPRRFVTLWLGLLGGIAMAAAAADAAAVQDSLRGGQFEEARLERLRDEVRAWGDRPGAAGPLSTLLAMDERLPPGRLASVLRDLVDGRKLHPLVEARAAYHLAVEEERRGDAAQASARWRALGFLNDFWLVGPFGAEGRSGLRRTYGPEDAPLDPRRGGPWAGKEREVAWRRVPGPVIRQGALMLDALMRPDSDAVAYVWTAVRSDRAQAAALRLGSPGPVKVWVNGVLVLERDVVRPPGIDQDAAPVRLRRGENWIAIKTVVIDGAWRLLVRLTDPSGRPLRGVTSTEPRGELPAIRSPARPAPIEDLVQSLRRQAEGARQGARGRAWLDLARHLAEARTDDRDAQSTEEALSRAIDGAADPKARWQALALKGEVARHEDDRRAAWQQAEAVAAEAGLTVERARALAALGEIARQRGRDAAALALLQQALRVDADCWPASVALAFEEQSAGLASAGLARLQSLPPGVRDIPKVVRARIRVREVLGQDDAADALRRTLHDARRTEVDLTQDLAASARLRGELIVAVRLLEEAATHRPDLPFLAIEAARIHEASGGHTAARALLEQGWLRLPHEPRLPEELGKLLARAGRTEEAVTILKQALVLRPQNPALRRYLARLAEGGARGNQGAEDLARQHAADGEAVAREALASAGEEPTVVLLDRRVVRVHVNGLSETFAQRLVHVRTARAAREQQDFAIRYVPGSQEVEIRRARVFRREPSGEIASFEASARHDRDLSEPWYGIYYDLRAEVVSHEDLRAGDVIELQYTVSDVGLRNEMASYFGDLQLIGETAPKRRWDYTLFGPRQRSFLFNEPRLAQLRRTTEVRGDETIYRFAAERIPRTAPEPSMPGFAEVVPYLHVSTYASWQDVGRWYWHLVADQLGADDTLRRLAAETTAGLASEEEKVRALHQLVLETTRYVALEFGIHGYKPYKVTQVLSRRFGDCKDKASLLIALLREVGIPSEIVLLRTRRNGRVEPQPASLAVFDHAIVYVPSLELYLDGTAEFAGMAELPSEDQGVMVLRVGPTQAVVTETPVFPSSANRVTRRWTVTVGAGGEGEVNEELTLGGQAAPEWRSHYQTPGERRDRLAQVWSGRFPGTQLLSFTFESIADRNRPVVVHSRAQVPRIAEGEKAGELALPLAARDPHFVRSYARLSARRSELVLAYPWQHEEEIAYHLPPGWRPVRMPASRKEQTAFGRFERETTLSADGLVLRVRSFLEVTRHRISPQEYPSFRRFLGAVDAALGAKILVAPEGR